MPSKKLIFDGLTPDAEVLIDLWLDQSSACDRDPIGIKGEPSYRYFWSTFTRYLKTGRNSLLPRALLWQEVTPVDRIARQTSPLRAGKESVDAVGGLGIGIQ